MTAERETKVFVLGITSMKGVDAAAWLGVLPNLADYDRVFVNTKSLNRLLTLLNAEMHSTSDENDIVSAAVLEKLEEVSTRLALVRKRLARVLATGGSVISIIQPYEGIVYYQKATHRFSRSILASDWQPVKLKLLDEPGDTLSNVEAEVRSYFNNVKRWPKVFELPTELSALRDELLERGTSEAPTVKTRTLATDRQGHAVGLIVWAGQPARGTTVVKEISGPFIAFVPPTEIDDEAAIRLLLSELHGIGTVSPPPDWLSRFQAPGEREAAARVEAALKNVDAAKAELAESEVTLRTAKEPLQILYEQHLALQDRCEDVFQRMGTVRRQALFQTSSC